MVSLNTKKEYINIINKNLADYNKAKEIFFAVQNDEVIIREHRDLPKVGKKELRGYIKYEILPEMPVDLENYIMKYKILDKRKSNMDIQVILFPKYIEKICSDIATGLKIERKHLNINFDIVQKLIDKRNINLEDGECIIMENLENEIILNSIEQNKIYTSNIFEKEGNIDYILNFLQKDINIFYYGNEDDFINKIIKNGLRVDKLKLNLKINNFCIEEYVDKNINKYLINVGMVV